MTNTKRAWVQDLLLLVVLAAATYFRVVGMNWDADQHLHPDERFLTMVETALQVRKCALPNLPVEACPADQVRWLGLSDYLDTGIPHSTRTTAGMDSLSTGISPSSLCAMWPSGSGKTGYDQVHLVGRQVSALSDLLTIVLVYVDCEPAV